MAAQMVMQGWGTVEEGGWRKGPWTAEEDKLLIEYVKIHGEGRWNSVFRLAGGSIPPPPIFTSYFIYHFFFSK